MAQVDLSSSQAGTVGVYVALGAFILIMGSALFLALRSNRRLAAVLAAYANKHGWQSSTPPPDMPFFQNLRGYKPYGNSLMEGDVSAHHFWIHRFWAGGGAAGRGNLYWAMLTAKLQNSYPTMAITPRKSAFYDILLKVNLNLVSLPLEGEATNSLSILVEAGRQEECSKFLSQDVLNFLQQNLHTGVIVSGNFASLNAAPAAAAKNELAIVRLLNETSALLKIFT